MLTVTCYVGPSHDLYHLSHALTGLCELAATGRIDLRLLPAPGDGAQPLESAVLVAEVSDGRQPLALSFDVYDRSGDFHPAAIKNCSICFKRSFQRPHLDRFPATVKTAVLPFGMNYGCRSAAGERFLRAAGLRLDESLNRYLSVLPFEEFEQPPNTPVESSIVFQTRAWAPESTSDNVEEVNESRARIIRELRKAFPGRFHGGFVPNSYARENYADLLTAYPDLLHQYVPFSKRRLIGVSTRGLHQSVPFKIPEYLAGSHAIVSEPLRCEFPAPFQDSGHFLQFETADECVAQCDRVLSDAAMAQELREASWRYYSSEVRPAQHIAALLERAMGLRPTQGDEESRP
jgi:hypothetical protein